MVRSVLCRVLFALCLVFVIEPAAAEKRIALVVGIDNYVNLPAHQQLKKAVNDSRSVSEALGKQGFEVFSVQNASRLDFIRAWQTFLNKIERGDVVALFYAGHGVEIKGQNYLLPSDMPQVQGGEEQILKAASLSTDGLLEELQSRGARLNLIILDACRDNPFASSSGRSIGSSRGLGHVQPASGTFIMYSAGIGQSALDRLSDDDQNPNSVYTRELLPLLNQPGLSLLQMATRVRRRVRAKALDINHNQVPAYYDEVIRDFYLAGKDGEEQVVVVPKVIAPTEPKTTIGSGNVKLACQRAIMEDKLEAYETYLGKYPGSECQARIQNLYAAKVEQIQWDKARSANSIGAYRGYLIAFADGIYAGQAKDRIQKLSTSEETIKPIPAPVDPAPLDDLAPLQDLSGYDVYGGDYKRLKKVSLNRCISVCQQARRCRAYTYNAKHNLCFMKDAVGTLMPNHDAVSGARQSDLRGVRPSNIRVYDNRDVAGSDYRKLRQTSFLGCYKSCEADGQCRSFSYVKRSATCWLKVGARPVQRRKGVRLGVKEN